MMTISKIIAGDYAGCGIRYHKGGWLSEPIFELIDKPEVFGKSIDVQVGKDTIESIEVGGSDSKYNVGQGVVGALFFGPLGLLAGGNDRRHSVTINWKDGKKSLAELNDIDYEELVKRLFDTGNDEVSMRHDYISIEDKMSDWVNKKFPLLIKKHSIPKKTHTVYLNKRRIGVRGHHIWVSDNMLNIFPKNIETIDDYRTITSYIPLYNYYSIVKVPIEEIEYFCASGKDIKLIYFSKKGNKQEIKFRQEDYQVLEDLIPEKNSDVVSAIKKNKLAQSSTVAANTDVIVEKIRKLSALKDEGILTEDEFSAKKNELLDKV